MSDQEHKNISILVVDDDDEFRGVVTRRFQRRGYDVTHSGNPSEALAMTEQKHFDVAIFDIGVADGGTLFIDEIGEMAGGLQAKLLRVLEDGRFRRVGSTKELKTDVRIIAATNKDLVKEVAANRFRDDLYFRLNVITIPIPSLRDRVEDVPLLVNRFLSLGTRGPRSIEPDALAALIAYRWPGNVRELANVIERARILADGSSITVRDLPMSVAQPRTTVASVLSGEPVARSNGSNLEELERQHIRHVLDAESWNKARAARSLGISRRRLYRLLEKHGLTKPIATAVPSS